MGNMDDKVKADKSVIDSENNVSNEKQMEGSAVDAQAASLTSSATSDSETSSLVETWTLVEKDEAEHEITEEPLDEQEKNFDDIKAPVGPSSSSRGMSSQVST